MRISWPERGGNFQDEMRKTIGPIASHSHVLPLVENSRRHQDLPGIADLLRRQGVPPRLNMLEASIIMVLYGTGKAQNLIPSK